jgi:hypothetical protein
MSIISGIDIATDSVGGESKLTVAFEDRGVAQGAALTNLLGYDPAATPPKLYPRGKVVVRTATKRTNGGVVHINVNAKRTEPQGTVAQNPDTNELYMTNVRQVLSTLSVTLAIPSSASKDPAFYERLKTALEADGKEIIYEMVSNLDDILVIS